MKTVQYIAFKKCPTNDPHKHLRSFIEICGTIKINDVTEKHLKSALIASKFRVIIASWFV